MSTVLVALLLWVGASITFALGFVVGAALARGGAWDAGYAQGLADSRDSVRARAQRLVVPERQR